PTKATRRSFRARRAGPRIAGLTISDTETVLSQGQVLERLGLAGDEFAEGIFARCGVKTRHLDLSPDFLARTLQGRAQQIEQDLMQHSIRAVEALGVDPARIGTVLSASLYSLGGPTLAHRLVDHFAMDPTTDKYHLTGIGCASGVPLMRLASQALRDHPEKYALVVAAESMSGILTRATPADHRAKVIGSAIFGDGCAAALLSAEPQAEGPTIVASQVHQIPDSLGAVRLEFSGEDGYLHLARELPDIAGAGLQEVVDTFLSHHRLSRERIDHWIVHPGGRRIIENVQVALELDDDQVSSSWNALASHGNVGTPSILYVLKEVIERDQPAPGERGLMVTVGPGVTVGLMLLDW
ncbi:MAG TPA: 3-oxoacyl-[acyl-carrier-protein] synthase III C-terminal domain-containing protein, partial [Solirubrobacteraceae bacterium]